TDSARLGTEADDEGRLADARRPSLLEGLCWRNSAGGTLLEELCWRNSAGGKRGSGLARRLAVHLERDELEVDAVVAGVARGVGHLVGTDLLGNAGRERVAVGVLLGLPVEVGAGGALGLCGDHGVGGW